jgi:hypothetical protein
MKSSHWGKVLERIALDDWSTVLEFECFSDVFVWNKGDRLLAVVGVMQK